MDNYVDNFKVEYVATNKEWKVTVTQNLDESILNARLDLVMMLTATDKTTNETGQCALIITLPIVNNKEAPKFSRIYYSGEYESGDNVSVSLENAIEIVNKEDLTKVEIGFDDSYKDNFEIYYQAGSSSWKLAVKSPLAEQILNTENEIILTLTATETNNTSIGEAVLILELPLGESKLPPRFNLPHYSAEYVIEDSKAIILLSDTITIINKKDLATITVTLDTYDTNFDIKYDPYNETWTLSVIDILSEDILKSTSELVLTLIATENDNENTGQSTLILTLPASQDNSTSEVISFSQVHYSANYSVVGNTGAIQMSDVISVKREESISDVSVTFENESYSSYFEIIQDSDNYAVSVVTELPQTVLNDFVSLPLSLVATAGDNHAYATLVIDLPVAANISAVEFSQPLYEGTYTVVDGTASFEVSDTIQVETDEEDVNIEYSVSSSTGYEEYFELSYAAKVLTVTKQNDLPEEVLRSTSVIPLILTVGISGTTYTSSAVLNVKVDFSDDEPSSLIEFSSVLFSGKYEADNGFGFLTVDEPVTVNTNEADSNVEVTISNEYHDYFTATYSNKIVSVLLSKPLSTGILNSSTFIPISLEASIIDTSYKSSAVLNIRIVYDSEDDPGTIEFSTVLYTADYSVDDGKGHLTVNQNIALITDASDDQIETSIADGSEFKNYFQTSYSSKSITVELTKEIPEDILTNTSIIPLTLTAEITGTTHRTSAVLNIDVHVSDELEDTSIIFSNVLYDGKYQVSDGIGVLTVSDQISVVTNASDDIIKVIVSNEYDGYFTASYSNKIVTITLVRQLSTELLNSSTFIPITLQASVTGSEHQASAVLNIKIKYDSNDDDTDNYIEFSSILYNSVYLVSNGKGNSEYSDYFTILYSSNIVTVAVTQNLSPVILEENTFIALTLNVGIKDTTQESSAVLNIKLPDDEDDTYISFSSVLYNGTYTVTDGTGVLTIKNQVEVLTNVNNDNVKVEITNEYSDYFRVTYLDKIVTISLIQQLPTTVLNSSSVIPILLQVSIVGGSYLDSSVLNIDIRYDSDNDPGTIEFAAVLYTAEYAIEDEKGTLKLNEDIKVITDSSDDKIEASLSDDAGYISYFSISYSNHIVSIKIREDLPQKALADNSFIVLTITVGIKGTTHRSSAVLNIKIDDDDTDNKSCEVLSMKTAYIAVICVLSILLLALITAAIAFYYLRLRSKNYANLEEEDGRVRFNKNTLQRSSSDIKPPSTLDERRPTGFIFNPINDDLDGTDSINDTEKSRRKSVAFDDNVEKLQIEPTEDNVSDDDNNNVDNSENFDDKSDNISDKSDNEVDNSDHKIDPEVTNV
ncbi:hypothetical protein NQ317_009679 [Molorchus minor]|uniref:Cadherin domain-containing protein n=1 Tax=Molorchus minor TaxID=1323400 RepID=A0ABQ9JHQ0_9CUCU|nr:hypothetical protein NQ317_009679 [Molorchus minor]